MRKNNGPSHTTMVFKTRWGVERILVSIEWQEIMGFWDVSAIVEDALLRRKYFAYSKARALSMFRREVADLLGGTYGRTR
jgi:hypothetical protein